MEGDEDRMGSERLGAGWRREERAIGCMFPASCSSRCPSTLGAEVHRPTLLHTQLHTPPSQPIIHMRSSCRCRGSPAAPHLVDTFTFTENVCHACYLLRESHGRDAGDTGRRHREGTRQGRPRLLSPLVASHRTMQYALRRPRGQRQNGPDRRLTSTKMSSLTRPCSGHPD